MEGIRKTVTMSGDSFTAWFQVDETYDIASNSSVLSITEMKLKTSDWYGVTMILDGEILINGHSVVKMSEFQGTHSVHISAKNEYVPVTGNPAPPWRSLDIPHNSDGSASTSVTVRLSGRSSGGGVRFRINGTAQMPLTTIPRVSEPSLSAGEARMGEVITVFTNRKSQSFTHTIRFRFGAYEASVGGVGDSCIWNIPDIAQYCNHALSGRCDVTVSTYAGGTKIGEKTVSFSLKVPRESTVLGADSLTMGQNAEIGAGRNSDNFTTVLSYRFGAASGEIGRGKADRYLWTPPLNLADQIPDSASGKLQLRLETYNGTALVGTSQKEVSLIVPQNESTRPVIEEISISPTGGLPPGWEGLFIRYKTGVAVTVRARGQHSRVESTTAAVDGKVYHSQDGSLTAEAINHTGDLPVTVTVRDSRGFETTEKRMISVLSYENPAVVPYDGNNQIVVVRASRDGTPSPNGGNLLIQAKRKYAKVISGGMQKNFCALRYRIRAAGGAFGSWKELLGKDAAEDGISITAFDTVPSPAVSYDVEVQAVDALGESSPISVHIPTDNVAFHIREGGKGAAFGKYAERDDFLESAWGMDMLGNRVTGLPTPERQEDAVPKSYVDAKSKDYIVAEGVSGNWFYRKWDSGFAECWQMLNFTFNSYLDKVGLFFRYPLELTYPFPFIQKQWSKPVFYAVVDSVHGLVTQRWTPERFRKFSGYVNTLIQYGTNNATGVSIYVSGYWK